MVHISQLLDCHVQLLHLTLANNSSIFPVSTCGKAQTIVITIQERFFKATAVYILHKNGPNSLAKRNSRNFTYKTVITWHHGISAYRCSNLRPCRGVTEVFGNTYIHRYYFHLAHTLLYTLTN